MNFKSLKHFPPRGNADEYDMESYMNRKQRPGRSIESMRNGIPVAVPGDRAFKKVEHEPGYYAKGGLIPGSSIQLRKSAKPEMRGGEEATKVTKNHLNYLTKKNREELKRSRRGKRCMFSLTNLCQWVSQYNRLKLELEPISSSPRMKPIKNKLL